MADGHRPHFRSIGLGLVSADLRNAETVHTSPELLVKQFGIQLFSPQLPLFPVFCLVFRSLSNHSGAACLMHTDARILSQPNICIAK